MPRRQVGPAMHASRDSNLFPVRARAKGDRRADASELTARGGGRKTPRAMTRHTRECLAAIRFQPPFFRTPSGVLLVARPAGGQTGERRLGRPSEEKPTASIRGARVAAARAIAG